jgi:hypothetical protein
MPELSEIAALGPRPRHAEPATIALSILRLSAWQRLAGAAVLITAIWAAVLLVVG